MYIKPAGIFYFADEPQFATAAPRHDLAHRLRCYRNARGNLGCRIYTVRRVRFGRYEIQMNTAGSPMAVILTHHA